VCCMQTPLKDGWGITSDGEHLVVGDSSDMLYFVDPATMQTVRSIRVTGASLAVRLQASLLACPDGPNAAAYSCCWW
jgi:glutamine cyclotransferase